MFHWVSKLDIVKNNFAVPVHITTFIQERISRIFVALVIIAALWSKITRHTSNVSGWFSLSKTPESQLHLPYKSK